MREDIELYVNYLQKAREVRRSLDKNLPDGLKPLQAAVLLLLGLERIEYTRTEICEHLGISAPQATELIKKLDDFVSEERDGTTKWLSLNDRGREVVGKIYDL